MRIGSRVKVTTACSYYYGICGIIVETKGMWAKVKFEWDALTSSDYPKRVAVGDGEVYFYLRELDPA